MASSQLLKTEIRLLMSSIKLYTDQMPQAKSERALENLFKITKKYDIQGDKNLDQVLKDLQYQYNFLKLSYPDIKNEVAQATQTQQQLIETMDISMEQIYNKIQKAPNQNEPKPSSQDNKESKPQNSKSQSGTFVMKDGHLVPGEAPKREFVDFSNWYAGNVDPEDLKKHKELLDRQHFGGPVWDGVKPKSIMSENPELYQNTGERQDNPNILNPKKENFEYVKR